MNKTLMFCASTLLCSLLAAPVVFAHRYDDGNFYQSGGRHHGHHHDYKKIKYLRAQLERNQAERRRVEWAYNQARRVRDWPTVRYEQARLDRLDREIRHDQYELHRAYEQARWDRHDDAWRGEYGYEYNRN